MQEGRWSEKDGGRREEVQGKTRMTTRITTLTATTMLHSLTESTLQTRTHEKSEGGVHPSLCARSFPVLYPPGVDHHHSGY